VHSEKQQNPTASCSAQRTHLHHCRLQRLPGRPVNPRIPICSVTTSFATNPWLLKPRLRKHPTSYSASTVKPIDPCTKPVRKTANTSLAPVFWHMPPPAP
jgi:hypothetical protein